MGNSWALSTENSNMRVLVDSDTILELFIHRKGFVEDVEMFCEIVQQQSKVEAYITDKCLKRIHSEDGLGEDAASFVEKIFYGRVISIDRNIQQSARESCLRDYDSAEEVACAKAKLLNGIVTHNLQNFEGEDLPVWLITNLLRRLQLELIMPLQVLYKNSSNDFSNFMQGQLQKFPLEPETFLVMSYEEAIRYFVVNRSLDPKIAKGAMLRYQYLKGYLFVQVFLDSNSHLICQPDGAPYGRKVLVETFDNELVETFADKDLVILE